MIFLRDDLAPWIVTIIFTLGILWLWIEAKFFHWVKEYWLLKRSVVQKLSTALILLGFIFMSIILMDPREGEIKVKGTIRQDKTIILVDTSTSMLAEDVRPSRLEKAVLIAKHFTRKAVGHQIGVMVFADITKKLVPFTSDLDLLDSRIDSIKGLRNMNAGSSIGLAIEEAVQFFDAKDTKVTGNIIVITDGEDNAETESFKLPDGVSLALIGVGTSSGTTIPMKDNLGMFYGYKKNKGITVVTRLNESFFKAAVKDNQNAKYFLAKSYDLPTEEVLAFLNLRKGQQKESDNTIRPVAMERWALPGLITIFLGLMLRRFSPFVVCFLLFSNYSIAQKNEPEIPQDVLVRIEKLKQGQLDPEERINLADQLVKYKMHEMAQSLYEENLDEANLDENVLSYFNWATSELESGNLQSAIEKYSKIEELTKGSAPELIERMNRNIRRALAPQPPQDKQDKKQNSDSEQNNQQGQSGQSGSGSDDDKKNEADSKNEKGKNPFDPKNKDDEKKQDQGGDSKDSKSNNDDKKEKPEQPNDASEDEKPKREKLSPLIQQLKQDDRKLQLKLLDTSTQKRLEGRKKDW